MMPLVKIHAMVAARDSTKQPGLDGRRAEEIPLNTGNTNNTANNLIEISLPTPTQFSNNVKPKAAILDEIDGTQWAIADSGCSDNYFTPKAKTKNHKVAHAPINVTLPDHTTLRSSHSCEMDVTLPKAATTGYVIPGTNNHSPTLISVTKLCCTGCKVLFSADECVVIHNGVEVLKGRLHSKNGLAESTSEPSNLMEKQAGKMGSAAELVKAEMGGNNCHGGFGDGGGFGGGRSTNSTVGRMPGLK